MVRKRFQLQRGILYALCGLFVAGCGQLSALGHKTAAEPLRVSANGRHFETTGGKPWFWLGDTAWSLLTAYTPQEEDRYLAARAKTGFTIVQVVAVWDGGTGSENGINPNADTAGVQPWKNHDPLQPNEQYWKNVDRMVETARRDGLYIGLLPAWGSYVVNTKMLTMQNAEAYGRWIGQRYKNDPNIVWIAGGDRDVIWYGPGSEKYQNTVNVWRALAKGLQEGDGGSHLIMLHPGGVLRNNQAEKWLAADMIQTWAWYKDIPKNVTVDYNLKPTKPVILAEGAYEGGPEYPTRPITPLLVRKQAYWTYLSGGFYTYGQNASWRKSPDWEAQLNSPGAQNMGVLRKLFEKLKWWELQPNQQLFAAGEGTGADYNAAAVSADKTWAMVYLSSATTVQLRLDQLKTGKLKATWIDPRSGARKSAGTLAAKKESFNTPSGWEDAVLLIQPK